MSLNPTPLLPDPFRTTHTLKDTKVEVSTEKLLGLCKKSKNTKPEQSLTVKSEVSPEILRDFASAIDNTKFPHSKSQRDPPPIAITCENARGLSQLCDEFKFELLGRDVSAFRFGEWPFKDCTWRPLVQCMTAFLLYGTFLGASICTFLCDYPHQTFPGVEPNPSLPKFNSSLIPEYYAHITDTHIADYQQDSPIFLREFFTRMRVVKPDTIFHTGDLIDNWDKDQTFDEPFPNETEWRLYVQIRNEFPELNSYNYVEILGNHDYWDVLSPLTNTTRPDRYLFNKPPDGPRIVDTFLRSGTRFITFLPLKPPVASGLFSYYVKLTSEFCRMLENETEQNTNASQTILLSHWSTLTVYPTDSCFDTFLENNCIDFMNGHSHVSALETWHHKRTVEFTLTAMTEVSGYGLFTIDNGRLAYRNISLFQNITFTPTYPIPDVVVRDVDCENVSFIRVLSFSPSQTRRFVVNGSAKTTLTPQKLVKPGVYLYSATYTFEDGHHSITITSESGESVTIDFSIGVQTAPLPEEHRDYPISPYSLSVAMGLSFAWVVLTLLIVIWGLFGRCGCCECCKLLDECYRWYYKKASNADNNSKRDIIWVFAMFIICITPGFAFRKLLIRL
jgi:hypothetical protein